MRLSDSIALGRVLIKLEPTIYLNGECTKGCAIGMGLAAIDGKFVGNNYKRMVELWPWLMEDCPLDFRMETTRVLKDWSYRAEIGCLAYKVHKQESTTLDQLIDWVRSVEPSEEDIVIMESTEEVEYASIT